MSRGPLVERLRPYFQTRPRVSNGRPGARQAPAATAPVTALTPAAEPIAATELERRREALAVELAKLHWDLGGLTYEMAIRDHFRLDLLIRHAARLQELDAELGAIDRMLRLEGAGAAGECRACGALYARGAVFCGQCGTDLVDRITVKGQSPAPSAPIEPAAAGGKPG